MNGISPVYTVDCEQWILPNKRVSVPSDGRISKHNLLFDEAEQVYLKK